MDKLKAFYKTMLGVYRLILSAVVGISILLPGLIIAFHLVKAQIEFYEKIIQWLT